MPTLIWIEDHGRSSRDLRPIISTRDSIRLLFQAFYSAEASLAEGGLVLPAYPRCLDCHDTCVLPRHSAFLSVPRLHIL